MRDVSIELARLIKGKGIVKMVFDIDLGGIFLVKGCYLVEGVKRRFVRFPTTVSTGRVGGIWVTHQPTLNAIEELAEIEYKSLQKEV